MRVLLIDPHDTADAGAWAGQRWDRIVDLGMGGKNTYARWTSQFLCPVTTLDSLRNGFDTFRRVRELLGAGCGRLIDQHGLDWWEIMSLPLHGELEALILLQRWVQTVGSGDEVWVSRPGLHASLYALSSSQCESFPFTAGSSKRRAGALRPRLQPTLHIATDRRFLGQIRFRIPVRARLTRRRSPSARPVVVLPTAYINVSRTGIGYANVFPEESFSGVSATASGESGRS